MKLSTKLIPLVIIGAVMTGCGKQTSQAPQRAHHSEQSRVAATPRKSTVKRDLKMNRHGARQHNYSSSQRAKRTVQRKINQQPRMKVGSARGSNDLPTVNLGFGIKGHQDRGAGQTYVTFKMGRWTLAVHGNDVNEKSDTAIKQAKQLVTYLQSHTLPIPSSQGTVLVNTESNSTKITWDHNHQVNNLNGKTSTVLQKAVTLK